jgi:hypothetical protein
MLAQELTTGGGTQAAQLRVAEQYVEVRAAVELHIHTRFGDLPLLALVTPALMQTSFLTVTVYWLLQCRMEAKLTSSGALFVQLSTASIELWLARVL